MSVSVVLFADRGEYGKPSVTKDNGIVIHLRDNGIARVVDKPMGHGGNILSPPRLFCSLHKACVRAIV